jgi:hypothetical protein
LDLYNIWRSLPSWKQFNIITHKFLSIVCFYTLFTHSWYSILSPKKECLCLSLSKKSILHFFCFVVVCLLCAFLVMFFRPFRSVWPTPLMPFYADRNFFLLCYLYNLLITLTVSPSIINSSLMPLAHISLVFFTI